MQLTAVAKALNVLSARVRTLMYQKKVTNSPKILKGSENVNDFLTYEEVEALTKGDRLLVKLDFDNRYYPATVVGNGTLASSPSIWIDLDDDKPGVAINITTGMQFNKVAWNESSCNYRFKRIDEPTLFD